MMFTSFQVNLGVVWNGIVILRQWMPGHDLSLFSALQLWLAMVAHRSNQISSCLLGNKSRGKAAC